ncbi:Uncharacterised protein [uncultured archaeon]|nr:Uncharacterised protein [uncultured archaeon]
MRIKILIVLSLFLLAFFAINACSVNWDDPESQTADEMFAGESGASAGWPAGEYPGPQASRAAQAGQENKAIIDLPVGGTLSSGATNPHQARSEETNQINTPQPVVANTTAPVQPTTSSDTTSVSGSWSLELNDSVSRTAALTLFQNGDAVYGTGSINLDANTTMIAAAFGTITGDRLNLDLVSLGKVNLYRISMTVNGDSATGSYTAFNPSSASTTGTANGVISAHSS